MRLLAQRGGAFPNLFQAREFTIEQIRERRSQLGRVHCPNGLSVVLFGSWARGELTSGSDDDWAIVVESDDAEPADVEALTRDVAQVLGSEDRAPGSQELFGCAFSCSKLVENIGLDGDTNTNLTRRVLLLLESVPLLGDTGHARAWDRVLETYLDRGAKSWRPPRFLLNDIVRYWRTICVDFEAKHRPGVPDTKWVTRNAKLRTSRKMLFAGGLIPLLACNTVEADDQFDFLSEQFRAVPVDRLAQAFLSIDGGAEIDAGIRGLQAYDRFVGLMADGAIRAELRLLDASDRASSLLWKEISTCGDELQQSLLALMFGKELTPLTKQFAIF